jgi:hypothetical protein
MCWEISLWKTTFAPYFQIFQHLHHKNKNEQVKIHNFELKEITSNIWFDCTETSSAQWDLWGARQTANNDKWNWNITTCHASSAQWDLGGSQTEHQQQKLRQMKHNSMSRLVSPMRRWRFTNRTPTAKSETVTKTKQNNMSRLVSPIRPRRFTNRMPTVKSEA